MVVGQGEASRFPEFWRREVARYRHDFVDAAHILLAVVEEGSDAVRAVWKAFDVDPERIRAEVERRLAPGGAPTPRGQLPFTPRAKTALEKSLEEVEAVGATRIEPEHLLLGVLAGGGIGAESLRALGVTLEGARDVVRGLAGSSGEEDGEEDEVS